ncbi:MAG: BatA domain-containing protein, partial [Phaeodactylibacter sp.]|nr:BatA domain-containing protein [Phaeodactylibacter sp.]
MQFLYPTFLFALAALAIPIIIHLFYFRRFKRVYFTNVRFLKAVKEETSARSRLRNLLVLLMRCLALTFLVFAFAQPFIPLDVKVKTGRKTVGVYVDNSFSMNAESEEVPLLELAKRRAREIVEAYSEEDEFQLLTNDLEGRHQRLVSKEDMISLIQEVETSPVVRPLTQILARQEQVLNQGSGNNQVSYLISDFQRTTCDLETYQDTTTELNLVPLQAVQANNISIDSIWFEAPVQMINQTNRLLVKVNNLTDNVADNIRLTLNYAGQVKPMGSLEVPASGYVVDTVPITILRTGWQKASVQITDFPIRFDDTAFFAFNVATEIKVLSVNEGAPNRFLDAAFRGIQYFKLSNQPMSGLDYSGIPSHQLVVLSEPTA